MPFKEIRRKCVSNLQQIRQEKCMSIEALAVLSGIDAGEICEIENGTTDFYISTLLQLAEVLNVDFRCILIDPDFAPRW